MMHILLIVAAMATEVSGASWYVRTDGLDGNDGKSWETAQSTIQLGIDNCRVGDTLYIAEGVYHEGIVLKDGIAIIGGCAAGEYGTRKYPTFDSGERLRTFSDVLHSGGRTILDGTGLGTRLISCEQDCHRPTLVQDLILQNARHSQRGGGAWLRGKVTMRRCVVRGCSGTLCGGVLIKGDLPESSALGARLEDCLVHNCTATGHEWPDAGGVANFDGTLVHCTIANNYGDRYGGIHSESSVYDCTMWGNRNEYGFVDPTNYVSDESESGMSRADEGFEQQFFVYPWLSEQNEATAGPHFRDPATFAGVPTNKAEEDIMQAADYSIGEPAHRIEKMPPAVPRADNRNRKTISSENLEYTVPSYMSFLVDSTATLVSKEAPYCIAAQINGDPRKRMAFCWFTNEGVTRGEVQLLAKKDATVADFETSFSVENVSERSQVENVSERLAVETVFSTVSQIVENASERSQVENASVAQTVRSVSTSYLVPASPTTTPPLHYAISSSGILNKANISKNTAFRYVSHKALADDLQPSTDYSWRCGYEGHFSEIFHFRTADNRQKDFSFVYMTDSHIHNQEYIDATRQCAEAVARNERDARFCVFPGDFVDTGTENNSEWEWERWFEEAMKPVLRQMPLVPTDGNHDDSPLLNYTYHFNTDTTFNMTTQVRPQFAGINYSFTYGDMQLIAFSEQDFWRGEYDYSALTSEYLERDLGGWIHRQVEKEKNVKWRVGLVHKNLFSGSDHQRDKETPLLRATLLPVMRDCHIDLLLQGHDHTYEVIGPVDPDTKKPILSAISNQETVPVDAVRNITGKKDGTYDVSSGTLYFIGATCGAKRYTPLKREEMDASKHIHQVDNYFDLFTGMFGQPGAPSYTRVTVKKDYLLLESFNVLPNGKTELFNTLKIVK